MLDHNNITSYLIISHHHNRSQSKYTSHHITSYFIARHIHWHHITFRINHIATLITLHHITLHNIKITSHLTLRPYSITSRHITFSSHHITVIVHHIPGGGTQLWVGYGCAARSFDHHPITKPEKTQICNLYQNHLFLEGPFLKPSSTFYYVNWDT